ncbi:hypothetical protein AB4142_18825 [Variovorax sp. 2RAF20]
MAVERLDPERLAVVGGEEGDLKRFIESDFKIRSGLCPNGCGLLTEVAYGQECPACNFSCNTPAEEGRPS